MLVESLMRLIDGIRFLLCHSKEVYMKKYLYFIGTLVFVFIILFKLVWKVKIIDKGKKIEVNKQLVINDLDIWALNSRAFFVIEATAECANNTEAFKVFGHLYSDSGIYEFRINDLSCSSSAVKINFNTALPKFTTFKKFDFTSTVDLNNYKITWYNAQP